MKYKWNIHFNYKRIFTVSILLSSVLFICTVLYLFYQMRDYTDYKNEAGKKTAKIEKVNFPAPVSYSPLEPKKLKKIFSASKDKNTRSARKSDTGYNIIGAIMRKGKMYAVVYYTKSNKAILVSSGDSIEKDVTVKRITTDKVIVREKNKRRVFKIFKFKKVEK